MTYSKEQIENGLKKFVEQEILAKSDIFHKWIIKTALDMAQNRFSDILDNAMNSKIMSTLGIAKDDGTFDIDELSATLKRNAELYGNAEVTIPFVGSITLTATDIDRLKQCISGGNTNA